VIRLLVAALLLTLCVGYFRRVRTHVARRPERRTRWLVASALLGAWLAGSDGDVER
jgi:hypothetical protein